MQSLSGSAAQPEAILEWLQKEMGYRPLGPYAYSAKAAVPTEDSLRKICRGNMIPMWNFLLKRVKSEKTVENIRRNILVHGVDDGYKGRRKEIMGVGKWDIGGGSSREMALQERELAEKEVERLRQIVRRQRKELKARMIEVSKEEAEHRRMLDVRLNYRYKYENDTIVEASSTDIGSPLQYHLYSNGKLGGDAPSRGTENQLLKRQKAHVQQFLATEDALNKAAEARNTSQLLLNRIHGSGDAVSSNSLITAGTSQNISSLRQLELKVWAKEREAAGFHASLNTLMSEVHRLDKLCAERKEAENSLRKKWKKIEEFDARRSELELIYKSLLKANMDAASFWSQQTLAAREYASSTVIPSCNIIMNLSNRSKDLIDKEVQTFYRAPDNSLYMLPSTPQALLESMGANASTGPEVVAIAERNAAVLTARAGNRDPSAVPSICRISAALQYPAGQQICLSVAAEQEKTVSEKWLPEITNAVSNAQKCLQDCKYVRGLLDEWWEQPASTVVDWIAVDGENVAAWRNHVKQLLAFYDK